MNQSTRPTKLVSLPRLFRLLFVACLVIYLVALVVVAGFQRTMIYHPQVRSSQRVDQMAQIAKLERWKNSSGEFIGMKRLSPRQPTAGQVLIVYGNASLATGCDHYADDIQKTAPLDVFILEYPGFADRPGSPSQTSLFQAADEALSLLDTNKPIYVLGESLGTGVASYLAGTYLGKVEGIILISPYNRLTGVAQYHMPIFPVRLMLIDRFPSEDYLRNYHGPVGMVVDGQDQVIPEKFGLRLYNGYAGPKRLWEFPLGEHASIMEPPGKFWKEVVEFWRTK